MCRATPVLVNEDNRRNLWEKGAELEKQALNILCRTKGHHPHPPVNVIKLLINSILLKCSDPFIATILMNRDKMESSEYIDTLAQNLQNIGLPPHFVSAIEDNHFTDQQNQSCISQEEIEIGSNFSDTITNDVRVKVTSFFDPIQSDPAAGQYTFAYKVGIFNECDEPIQVVGRMWDIEKYSGEKESFRANGVKEVQPIISPGDVFTYQSSCPLRLFPPAGKRKLGKMSGYYTIRKGNVGDEVFNARIGQFSLLMPPQH